MTRPTKWPVRLAKTQISQGIHPVWSESSLGVQVILLIFAVLQLKWYWKKNLIRIKTLKGHCLKAWWKGK